MIFKFIKDLKVLNIFLLLAPAFLFSSLAFGQADDEDENIEEVVVTGYKASLKTATDVKKNSDRIVDSIVALDVGKLPDSNVAEALQRVTGIQIDRDRGEGSRVAIRGLSADLNRAEINGMAFAGTGTSREADFRNIPSDFISRIDVIKSPTASMTDGAMGGWINIVTRRPFDEEGMQFLGSLKMRGGPGIDTTVSDEYSPETSFYVSNTFNEQFGASFTYHGVQHDSRADILEDLFWSYYDVDGDGNSEYFPHLPRYFQSIVTEERSAYIGAAQFRPNDDLELILDITHSERDNQVHNFVNNFINWVAPATNIVERDDTIVGYDVSNAWFQTLSSEFDELRETDTVSLTTKWNYSDDVNVSGLFGSSAGTYDNPLFNAVPMTPTTGPVSFSQHGSDNIWQSDFDYSFGSNAANLPWFLMTHSQQLIEQDESLAQIDIEYLVDMGAINSFEFGVQSRGTSFDSVGVELPRNFFGLDAARAHVGNDAVYDAFLANVMVLIPGSFGDIYSSNPPGIPSTFYVPDTDLVNSVFYTAAELEALRNYDESILTYGKVWNIEESITAAYIQTNFESVWEGMPLSGNFGIRWVTTETDTNGYGNADKNDPVSFDGKYSDVLPALNLRLDISDTLTARLAWSSVISRPTITDLVPRLTYNSVQLEASGGNPELDPFRADQVDVILEYYPSDDTAFAAGLFFKEVESFVENQIVARDLFGDGQIYRFSTPVNGKGAEIKGLEVSASHNFAAFDGLGVLANYTYVDSTSMSTSQITGENLPFPGLSEVSYNLAVFYEKDGISSRVAYNYRDEHLLTSTGSGVFPAVSPVFIDEYASLDASTSYSFNVQDIPVSVFVSGINLTDSYSRHIGQGGFNRNVASIAWGPMYEFGVRVSF